jgi:tripartite-type tricarboxylate transporter receptor subunit TctC
VRSHRIILLTAILASGALAPAPAAAQFYRGKQIQVLIAGTAGGGIDIGARILARHLGKYLPGNPAIVPQLMPGAGGIRMLDHMISVAPKDGTVIGITPPGPLIEPLIGKRQASYRMADFVAIGAMTKEVSLCISWGASKFKTIEDATKDQMVVAGTGAGASPDIYPIVLNEVLHTNFKVITGYQGSQETIVAIERGEVDGRCGWSWSSVESTRKVWLTDKKITILMQLSLKKHPDLPDVPLIIDLAKTDEQRQILKLIFARQPLGRPYLAPPGVPADRVALLRKAFMDTMADKEFLAEAEKAQLEITPIDGASLQKLVTEVYQTPAAIAHKAAEILR